jgi:uncharacterized protein
MWEDEEDEEFEGADEDPVPPSPVTFVRSALIFYGVLGCGALVWRMSSPGESIFHPSAAVAPEATVGFAICAGLVLGLAAVVLSELMTRFTELGEVLADTLGESLAGISAADAVLLAVASGIAEEMLFRGALQPSAGLFWASLAFGACHFLPRKELALWSLYAVGMGFALGLLFEWTGQLAAPIAAHTVINAVNLPRLARRSAERKETSES